ncbi:MAG TPA: type II toxin-antitoxin system RelE/ParE family toxin [Chitinophagales bacterium]|nr:type II toxin-antitoxin system RelE/ParE family toxin [Chitinophagales bacterium]
MSNKIFTIPLFDSKYKKFLRKFPSLPDEMKELQSQLLGNPFQGANYGSGIYKIRVASKSKGRGKSGGFRVITYLIDKRPTGIEIYLITIFDKSEESTLTKEEVKKIIKRVF